MNDDSPLERGLYLPVLVGGMARSGTTLLSALISTSSSCNPFAPEPHYLGHLANVIPSLSLPNQECFYRNKEERLRQHFKLFRNVLDEAWAALGRPKILVVKHVFMTPVCGLIGQHLPQAKFIAIMRDPRDIFASMLRSRRRQGGVEHEHPSSIEKQIVQWVLRFNQYYGAVLMAAVNELKGRLLAVDHETLCRGNIYPLANFLNLSDIDPDKLWERSVFNIKSYENDPLFSEGWGKPLSSSSTRSHRNDLSDHFAQIVSRDTRIVRATFLELAKDLTPTLASLEAL